MLYVLLTEGQSNSLVDLLRSIAKGRHKLHQTQTSSPGHIRTADAPFIVFTSRKAGRCPDLTEEVWCYLVEAVRHLSVAEIVPHTKLVPFSRPKHAAWSSSLIWWPICKCTTSPIIVTLRMSTNLESKMVRQFRRSHRRRTWRDLGLISQRNGYLHRAFGSVGASVETGYSRNIMICFRKNASLNH